MILLVTVVKDKRKFDQPELPMAGFSILSLFSKPTGTRAMVRPDNAVPGPDTDSQSHHKISNICRVVHKLQPQTHLMVPPTEDGVLSNTDYLMGAVMEARVILPLGRQGVTRCSICTIAAFFYVQFILSLLRRVQVEELSTFWLSWFALT